MKYFGNKIRLVMCTRFLCVHDVGILRLGEVNSWTWLCTTFFFFCLNLFLRSVYLLSIFTVVKTIK